MNNTLFFRELAVRNFLSFGNQDTVIDLAESGTVEVVGQNLDKGGSNGSGKTTIINAICYALYNKPFDNISLQRLINSTNSMKNTLMEVRLLFEKDGEEYEITRTRGEHYTIKVTRNGDDITPGKGVTECDAMIEGIIGISYDLFTRTLIFSGNSPAFLQLPIALQRQHVEEMFNITLLSEKAKILRDKIRETESDIAIQSAVVKQQEVAVDLHTRHVKEAKDRVSRWDQNRLREIAQIEQTLAVIGTIDFESEQALHDEKAELAQEGAYLAAKLAPAKKDLQRLTTDVEKLMSDITHLADAKCPYCSQNFADAPSKIAHLESEIDQKGAKLIETEAQVNDLVKKARAQQERLMAVEGAIQHSNLSELLNARENASILKTKLEDLKTATNPHIEGLERLMSEGTAEVDYEKVNNLKKRLEHQTFLLKLLTNKDSFLRRRILNKTIPFLNARINHYTSRIGLPHVVKFDADMSCTVSEFGRELDFGNLSAGEKKRVNVGLALAFRDVLHHLHAKSNLLLVDELDGQLDGTGVDSIVSILKEKSRDEEMGIYIISHHPNVQGRLDRTMIIQKQHGFSQLVQQ